MVSYHDPSGRMPMYQGLGPEFNLEHHKEKKKKEKRIKIQIYLQKLIDRILLVITSLFDSIEGTPKFVRSI
jgi:hypothetical protein